MQNRLLTCDHCPQRIGAPVIFLLAAVAILNGCGTETYEQRLNETAQYFTYVDARNQALAANWSSPTVKMRPPIEFKQLKAPQAAPAKTSEESEPSDPEPTQTVDPRQPDYLDLVLPGLEGAWRVEVPVDVDNETEERPAYLYVLSNHYLLQEKRMDEALNFFTDVNSQLAGAFNQFLNTEEFTTEKYPPGKGYSEPQSFQVGTFDPENPIGGIPYQLKIYLQELGNNQVVILLLIPKNIARESKLKEHIDYSLETFSLSSKSNRGRPNGATESSEF